MRTRTDTAAHQGTILSALSLQPAQLALSLRFCLGCVPHYPHTSLFCGPRLQTAMPLIFSLSSCCFLPVANRTLKKAGPLSPAHKPPAASARVFLPGYCHQRSPATWLSLSQSSCLSLSMLVHPGSFLLLLHTNFSPLKQGILPSSSASLLLLPCSRAQSKCPHTQLSFCEIFSHLPLPYKDKDACLLFGP